MTTEHRREAQYQNQVINDLSNEDMERLNDLVEIRTQLEGYRYEMEAQHQWDSFLSAVRESAINTDFAPPQELNLPEYDEFDVDAEHQENANLAYAEYCEYGTGEEDGAEDGY